MTHLRISDCVQSIELDDKETESLLQILLDRSKRGPITIGGFISGIGSGIIVKDKNYYHDITNYKAW